MPSTLTSQIPSTTIDSGVGFTQTTLSQAIQDSVLPPTATFNTTDSDSTPSISYRTVRTTIISDHLTTIVSIPVTLALTPISTLATLGPTPTRSSAKHVDTGTIVGVVAGCTIILILAYMMVRYARTTFGNRFLRFLKSMLAREKVVNSSLVKRLKRFFKQSEMSETVKVDRTVVYYDSSASYLCASEVTHGLEH